MVCSTTGLKTGESTKREQMPPSPLVVEQQLQQWRLRGLFVSSSSLLLSPKCHPIPYSSPNGTLFHCAFYREQGDVWDTDLCPVTPSWCSLCGRKPVYLQGQRLPASSPLRELSRFQLYRMCFLSSSVTKLALLLRKLLMVSGGGYLVAPSALHVSGSFLRVKLLLMSHFYRDICVCIWPYVYIERELQLMYFWLWVSGPTCTVLSEC